MKETTIGNVWSEIARQKLFARLNDIQRGKQLSWFTQREIDAMQCSSDDILTDTCDKAQEHNMWICPIKIEDVITDPYYSISKAEIVMPPIKAYSYPHAYYGEMLHNMAHSTGSERYLDRISLFFSFESKQHAFEELVSELSAAYVCAAYGIIKDIKSDSVVYLKTWIDNLETYDDYIIRIGDKVQQCVKLMFKELDRVKTSDIPTDNTTI